jgi:hypothetical protein
MNTKLKLVASGLLLAGSVVLAPSAYAGPCPDTQTFAAWSMTAGGCLLDDKVFAFGSVLPTSDYFDPATINVNFIISPPINPTTWSIVFDPTTPQYFDIPGFYAFTYTVEIVDPNRVFSAVKLDSDVGDTGVVINKKVDGTSFANLNVLANLTSTDGSNTPFTPISGKKIWVTESITIAAGSPPGSINSMSNVYRQAQVPEPMSGALLGLGLVGLGLARRRKVA